MIRRVNTKEKKFAQVNGNGSIAPPSTNLRLMNGGGSSGSTSTSSNGNSGASTTENNPAANLVGSSDMDKRQKRQEELGFGSQPKITSNGAGNGNGGNGQSDSDGLPEFNIAGFNGYLMLVLVGMVIVAMRYK